MTEKSFKQFPATKNPFKQFLKGFKAVGGTMENLNCFTEFSDNYNSTTILPTVLPLSICLWALAI